MLSSLLHLIEVGKSCEEGGDLLFPFCLHLFYTNSFFSQGGIVGLQYILDRGEKRVKERGTTGKMELLNDIQPKGRASPS